MGSGKSFFAGDTAFLMRGGLCFRTLEGGYFRGVLAAVRQLGFCYSHLFFEVDRAMNTKPNKNVKDTE